MGRKYTNKKTNSKCKGDRKGGYKDKDVEPSTPTVRGDNDVSWYANQPQILMDSASYPFSQPLGTPFKFFGDGMNFEQSSFNIPGIMSIVTVPTYGNPQAQNDPINVSARNLYSFVRHANSGHSNYDAPNLMMYIMGMGNVYSYYSWMCRLYGIMSLATAKNKFLPKALITSQGVDYFNLLANLSNFRAFINKYAVKVGSMCVPKGMTYFMRTTWMYENIYMDDTTSKAQMYMFTPYGFHKYNEPVVSQPSSVGSLTLKELRQGSLLRVQDLIDYGEDLLAPILQSEDMNIMSGDILKAFGEGGLLKITQISSDYATIPTYSPEVLNQIHNSRTLFGAGETKFMFRDDSFTLRESTAQNNNAGALILDLSVTKAYNLPICVNAMLDVPAENPTPGDVMVATRLAPMFTAGSYDSDLSEWNGTRIGSCGTEIPLYIEIYNNAWDAGTVLKTGTFGETYPTEFSSFQHAPLFYVTDQAPDVEGGKTTVKKVVGPITNFTNLNFEDFNNLHSAANLSLFNVPQLGMWTF